jgi:6-phosphogluconolactonase
VSYERGEMLKREVNIFRDALELSEALATQLINQVKGDQKDDRSFTVALPGGNTPVIFFSVLTEKYSTSIDWNNIHFFWGDERCVHPDDPESNYGLARKILLNKISVPKINIHRIRGEDDPQKEAKRYSDVIKTYTRSVNSLPSFDLMILGLGNDGHTASIFPGNIVSFSSRKLCEVAVHPCSGQKRITITGKVINNSRRIIFLVAGESKARVIEDIFNEKPAATLYPASYVIPVSGNAAWMLDENAAKMIR